MPIITLTPEEQIEATDAGNDTWKRHREKGSVHKWGRQNDDAIHDRIDSYGAEIAASRVTGHKWVYSKLPDHDGDLGPGEQVRQTKYRNGKLLLHPEDEDDHKFILVTGTMPTYNVVGWMYGKDGKHQSHWDELIKGRPCFAVKQFFLQPMSTWSKGGL